MEARLKAWIEDLSARNKSLETENETLKNTNILIQGENGQLKRQIEGLTGENNAFKERIESLVKENNTLKDENGSLLSFRTILDERDGCAVLRAIERVGRESGIQSLQFGHNAGVSLIHHLLRMSEFLKLKKLSIVISVFGLDDDDVDTYPIELATCFKETLQHFKYHTFHRKISMEFPIMPNLKSLDLNSDNNLCLNPVNMKVIFPVLETLKIPQGYGFVGALAHSDPCATIRSFTYHELINISEFHNVLRVFPKLTKFDMCVGEDDADEIFRGMWTHMTELESLNIQFWLVKNVFEFDSLFTGIPSHVLKDIRPVVNGLTDMSHQEREETILILRAQHSHLPSISNLKKLRQLTLGVNVAFRGSPNSRPYLYLSDLTGYLALYSLNHLRSLHVTCPCEFTPECCELLKKNGLDSWKFLNRRFKDIIPPFPLHEELEEEDN